MNGNGDVNFAELPDGTRIAYIDCGKRSGPTLLFIHGLANYLWVWKWNIAKLQENYRCIAIDLPGNGFSSRGDYPYSIPYFADTIAAFVHVLHLRQVHLVGHSMGGQIALQCALNKHFPIHGLILCAPAGFEYYSPGEATLFKSAIAFGNFMAMDESHIAQSIHASFFGHHAVAEQIIDDLQKIIQRNDRVAYRRMLEMSIDSMLDTQLFPSLKLIQHKTLVFFGENDQLIPNRFLHPVTTRDIGMQGCREMPDALLYTYKDTGHFVHIEQAGQVNQAIERFLDL